MASITAHKTFELNEAPIYFQQKQTESNIDSKEITESKKASNLYLQRFMEIYHDTPEFDPDTEKKLGENYQFKQIVVNQKMLFNTISYNLTKLKNEICCLKISSFILLFISVVVIGLAIYLRTQGII